MRSIRGLHQTGVASGVAGHETMFICRNPQETPNTIMYMRRNEVPANYLPNDGKPEGLQVCIRFEAMSVMTGWGGGGGVCVFGNILLVPYTQSGVVGHPKGCHATHVAV